MSTRIIVGVSQTLAGLQALRYAVTQARTRRVELLAVRTWARPTDPGLIAAAQIDSAHAQALAEIREAFEQAMGAMPTDITVNLMACGGSAPATIVLLIQDNDDLVVLGAGAHRWRRSRTVAYCVRHARCPIVVVPVPAMVHAASARRLLRDLRREIDAPRNHPVP